MLNKRNMFLIGVSVLLLGMFVGILFFGGITGNVIGEWVTPSGLNSSYVEIEQDVYVMNLYMGELVEFPWGNISFDSLNDSNYNRYLILFEENQSLNGLNDSSNDFSANILENSVFYFQENFDDAKEYIVGINVTNYSYDAVASNDVISVRLSLRNKTEEYGWTQWINPSKPMNGSDYLEVVSFSTIYGTQLCNSAQYGFNIRTVDTHISWEESGQKVIGDVLFYCSSLLNPDGCYDYELSVNCGGRPYQKSFCSSSGCEMVEGDPLRLPRTNVTVTFNEIGENNFVVSSSNGYSNVTIDEFTEEIIVNLGNLKLIVYYPLSPFGPLNSSEGEKGTLLMRYSYNASNVTHQSYCDETQTCYLYEGQTLFINDTGHSIKAEKIQPSNGYVNLTFDGMTNMEKNHNVVYDYEDLNIYHAYIGLDPYGNIDDDYLIFTYTSDYTYGYWTPWFDDDTPNSSKTDTEDRWTIYGNHPDEMCERPSKIECQTLGGTDWYVLDEGSCLVGYGFHGYDPDINDYRVRFYCVPPLSDGSYCQAGTCYLFENDNVTIVENGEVYVINVDNIVQGSYPEALFRINDGYNTYLGISESGTYSNLNMKVTSVLYPYSADTKDIVIFDYTVAGTTSTSTSTSSGGGGGSSKTSEDVVDITVETGCDGNICRIYNYDNLNVAGHNIYTLLSSVLADVYLELDDFLEKFVSKNSLFKYENLTIKILDFTKNGLSTDYVEFEYSVENKNYVKHCDGPRCTIEEGHRLSLGTDNKIVAVGGISTKIIDGTAEFFYNGNKHYMEDVPFDINSNPGPNYVYSGLIINPVYIQKGTGEYGGDELTFEFTDLGGSLSSSNVSFCENDICRIYSGDKVSTCGHEFTFYGMNINTFGMSSRLGIDGFYHFIAQNNTLTSYENISVSVRDLYSVEEEMGTYENPSDYTEIKCNVVENKNYVTFCSLGEECKVNGSRRIMLVDNEHILGFDQFEYNDYTDHEQLDGRIYYLDKEYYFYFDSGFPESSIVTMDDISVTGVRIEKIPKTAFSYEYVYVFTFAINDSYVWPTVPVSEGEISSSVDYDNYIPTSVVVSQEDCSGCYDGTRCYDVSYRTRSDYCSTGLEFLIQKPEGDYCNYNFECYSNYCDNSVCSYTNLWQRLGRWFSWIFG